MKRILFPTDFSEVATNAFVHALEFAKIVQGELILLHTFDLPVFDNQFFPENYAVIYDSLELAQFEMFKDEIPKLRAIAEERNLDKIKMSHRLMDGDYLVDDRYDRPRAMGQRFWATKHICIYWLAWFSVKCAHADACRAFRRYGKTCCFGARPRATPLRLVFVARNGMRQP